jgi:hypothetical protein
LVVSSDAPQFAQNRPVPGVPHDGQMTSVVDGCVMRYNLHSAGVTRRVFGMAVDVKKWLTFEVS